MDSGTKKLRTALLLGRRRFFGSAILLWRQWQPDGCAHDVALFRGEHPFEPVGIDDFLALLRWHGAQVANRGSHHGAPLEGNLLHPAEDFTRLVLLFRRQVRPPVHVVYDALLLPRGKACEIMQLLPQALLLLRRHTPESGIVLQGAIL